MPWLCSSHGAERCCEWTLAWPLTLGVGPRCEQTPPRGTLTFGVGWCCEQAPARQ